MKPSSASSTCFTRSPDGTRLAFDVTGRGPGLLLLHGGGLDRRTWHDIGYVERLRDEFTLVAVDARGHGESDRPAEPSAYATDRICQDLLAVADAAGLDRFAIWGFSYGANMGRYLAARSGRVYRIILIGGGFGPGASGGFRESLERRCLRWTSILEDRRRGTLDPDTLSEEEQGQLESGQAPVLLAWLSALLEWGPVLPSDLRCPALCVAGSRDEDVLANLAEYAPAMRASGVEMHVLDGLDHWQEFLRIDVVLPAMLRFMRA